MFNSAGLKCEGTYRFTGIRKVPSWTGKDWVLGKTIDIFLIFGNGNTTSGFKDEQTDYYYQKFQGHTIAMAI